MNQTPGSIAIILPLMFLVGLGLMLSLPALALRASRELICPQRMQRESAAGAHAAPAVPLPRATAERHDEHVSAA